MPLSGARVGQAVLAVFLERRGRDWSARRQTSVGGFRRPTDRALFVVCAVAGLLLLSLLATPTSAQVVYCNGQRYWGACPEPEPEPKLIKFALAPSEPLPRCEALVITDLDQFRDLERQLRNDAFGEAFRVFRNDLDTVNGDALDLSTRVTTLNREKCGPYNKDARGLGVAEQEWNKSACVDGVRQDQAGECRKREAELRSWREGVKTLHKTIVRDKGFLDDEFQSLYARAKRAVLNAQNALNPNNTEQAHRLYMWYVLKEEGRPPRNSCLAFARITTALGRRVAHRGLFIDYLARNIVEPQRMLNFFTGDPPFTPLAGQVFNASGFKRKYYQDLSENQVRHAGAYLAIGYELASRGPGAIVSYYRDLRLAQREDYDLAVAAGRLGAHLASGRYTTANFGAAMATELCN